VAVGRLLYQFHEPADRQQACGIRTGVEILQSPAKEDVTEVLTHTRERVEARAGNIEADKLQHGNELRRFQIGWDAGSPRERLREHQWNQAFRG
jgi:hypothetical protein